jgi:MOSC domain-containing protein YiiM
VNLQSRHASWKSIVDRAFRRIMPGVGAARAGVVTAIFVADGAGAAMQARDQVQALVDAGLEADRYASGRGFWRLTDGCQVTLIRDEDLRRAERRHGLALDAGQHRRNLVVAGLARGELRGCRLRVGAALLEWQRVRPPCGYLDRISGRGTAKALGRNAGHCFRVLEAGLIRVGDPVVRLPLQ